MPPDESTPPTETSPVAIQGVEMPGVDLEAANHSLRTWCDSLQKALADSEARVQRHIKVLGDLDDTRDALVQEITEQVFDKLRQSTFHICLPDDE